MRHCSIEYACFQDSINKGELRQCGKPNQGDDLRCNCITGQFLQWQNVTLKLIVWCSVVSTLPKEICPAILLHYKLNELLYWDSKKTMFPSSFSLWQTLVLFVNHYLFSWYFASPNSGVWIASTSGTRDYFLILTLKFFCFPFPGITRKNRRGVNARSGDIKMQ